MTGQQALDDGWLAVVGIALTGDSYKSGPREFCVNAAMALTDGRAVAFSYTSTSRPLLAERVARCRGFVSEGRLFVKLRPGTTEVCSCLTSDAP